MIPDRISPLPVCEYDKTPPFFFSLEEASFIQKALGVDKTCFECHPTTTAEWHKNSLSENQHRKCYSAARSGLKRKTDTLEVVNTKNPRLKATPCIQREIL